MTTLDDQRRKRPGNRDRINQIKDEMDQEVLRTEPHQPDTHKHTVRDRIAAAIQKAHSELHFGLADTWDGKCSRLADAVIAELGLKEERAVEVGGGSTRKVVRLATGWSTDDR